MTKIYLFSFLAALISCSSANPTITKIERNSRSDGGNSNSPITENNENPLYGNWLYINESTNIGIGASFEEGKYLVAMMRLTSETTAQTALEKGRLEINDQTLIMTPEESSCSKNTWQITEGHYSVKGVNLTFTYNKGIIGLQRNKYPPLTNFVIVFGCFDASGKFTASSLNK